MRLPRGLAALHERNYVLYLAGQFTSQLGTWAEQTAVAWILYELTDSPLLLGLSGLARAAPMIALGLVGGAIADRVPRRTLLFFTESAMLAASLAIGLLAAAGKLHFWHLYVLNFASGALSAFSVPARQALFVGLVPRSAMQSAVSLNAVAVRGGALVGPSLGGLALAYGGYALPFLVNAASFVAILLALAAMRLPRGQTGENPHGLWQAMTHGVEFVWRSPALKMALGLELFSGIFGHNVTLITVIARDVLGSGPEGLGVLLSAVGAGALLSMMIMVAIQAERHVHVILGAGAAYTVLLAGFALSHWLWLSMIVLFALGAADGAWAVTRNTLAQLLVPDALRGRVMSIVVLATRGSAPLGRLQAGFLAELFGGPAAALLGAAVIGIAVLRSWRLRWGKQLHG